MKKINIIRTVHIIHEYEFLALYIGENVDGQYIIASLLDEDDEEGLLMYIHVFVDNSTIKNFLIGQVSYLEVLKRAQYIYRVDKDYNYDTLNSYKTSYEELEQLGTVPSEDSFFTSDVPIYLLQSLGKNQFYTKQEHIVSKPNNVLDTKNILSIVEDSKTNTRPITNNVNIEILSNSNSKTISFIQKGIIFNKSTTVESVETNVSKIDNSSAA